MFTRRGRSGQDVVAIADRCTVTAFGSRGILARAARFGMSGPTRGYRVLRYSRSEELFQVEHIGPDRVMFVGRSAIALDLRVRGDDRHVVAPRVYL